MTPKQSKEWFEKNHIISGNWGYLETEQLYQAFRARLYQDFKRDSTCNCLVNIVSEETK